MIPLLLVSLLLLSTRVGGHEANPTNTADSSALEFILSSLTAASQRDRPIGEEVPCFTQVPQGEEEINEGLL
jgi:hypothetical protein